MDADVAVPRRGALEGLAYFFHVTDFHAANELLRVFPGLTWELLFVAICESRQACSSFADGGRTFTAILATVGAQQHRFTRIINSLTEHLVHRGVTQSNCVSTRLFTALAQHLHITD